MRRFAVLLIILLCLLPTAAKAEETDFAAVIDEELRQLELGDLESVYENLDEQVADIFGSGGFRGLVASAAQGDTGMLFSTDGLLELVISGFRSRIGLLCLLVALGALGGVVGQMHSQNGAAGFVCCAMCVMLAVSAFAQTAAKASAQADTAKEIMELALPMLLTMLSAAGAAVSAGLLGPLAGLLSTGVMQIFTDLLLPAVLAMGVCAMVGSLSRRHSLERFGSLLKSVVKWVSGAVTVLYLGYGTIIGFSAKSADGLSVKLLRYSADKLVPVVGGLVSGSVDTVMHTSVLLKNALGTGAVLLMLGTLLLPLIDIMTLQLAFRLAAALSEPYADERMVKGIGAMADVTGYLFAAVAGIGVMFAATVGLIASAGSAVL